MGFLKIAKNDPFWPKIGYRSADFAEILGIDKNHLNTSYVKFLGHLGHFLAKYGHFWSFLAHFGLYKYIGEYAGRASIPVILPLAFTAITSEPLVRFRKVWAFLKEESKGYLVAKLEKISSFWALPPPGP